MLDIREIMKLLPHRYPMLLVDRVLEYEIEKRIVCTKSVTTNEPFFQGHFPGNPVMPGVLIVEGMAQAAAVLVSLGLPNRDEKLYLFGGVDKARFRRQVIPGDVLRFECTIMQKRSNTVRVHGVATVDGAAAAEADLLSIMVERPH